MTDEGSAVRDAALDELCVRILRGATCDWPFGAREPCGADEQFDDRGAAERAFLDFVKTHRLMPLVHHKLQASGKLPQWPEAVRDGLAHATRAESAYQMLRNRDVRKLVSACRDQNIEPIFFKGIALANTVYPAPQTRPSVDVDLLVRAMDIAQLLNIFESIGYERHAPFRGEMHANVVICRRQTQEAVIEFDCHLAINNRPLLARLMNYEELRQTANSLVELGAFIPSQPHSLALACLHRAAHHNTEDLLWLNDMAYLVAAMSESEREQFCELCASKRIRRICADGLNTAGETLDAEDLRRLAARLDPENAGDEPTAVYIRPNRNAVGDAFIRWNSLDTPRKKIRYAVEMALPNREFLRWKYGKASAWLYAKNVWDVVAMIAKGLFAKKSKSTSITKSLSNSVDNRKGPSHH